MITTEQLNALLEKNLELICFAKFSIYVHLNGGIMLTIQAGYEHTHDGISKTCELSSPVGESALMTVLENTLTSATVDPNGDLCIRFSNSDTVRIFKEPGYESYRLKIGSDEFIF